MTVAGDWSALCVFKVPGITSQSDDNATGGCKPPLLASALWSLHRLSSWLISAAGDIGHVYSVLTRARLPLALLLLGCLVQHGTGPSERDEYRTVDSRTVATLRRLQARSLLRSTVQCTLQRTLATLARFHPNHSVDAYPPLAGLAFIQRRPRPLDRQRRGTS